MTGHGKGQALWNGRTITVECATVNRKGIEVAIALPKPLVMLEPKIRESVQRAIHRGRVNLTITIEQTDHHGEADMIDISAARRVLEQLQRLRKELKLAGEITLDQILRAPGVIHAGTEQTLDAEEIWPEIESALSQALQRVTAMRRKEGAHLVTDLRKRVRVLEQAAKAIRARVPAVMRERRNQLQVRLEQLGVTMAPNDQSLSRELALMAERSDITEELTRLQSHFVQCREALAGHEPAGRTLDYLAQEMFREINTLGNKAGDAAISQRVVQSKAELDRIREQVANLE